MKCNVLALLPYDARALRRALQTVPLLRVPGRLAHRAKHFGAGDRRSTCHTTQTHLTASEDGDGCGQAGGSRLDEVGSLGAGRRRRHVGRRDNLREFACRKGGEGVVMLRFAGGKKGGWR